MGAGFAQAASVPVPEPAPRAEEAAEPPVPQPRPDVGSEKDKDGPQAKPADTLGGETKDDAPAEDDSATKKAEGKLDVKAPPPEPLDAACVADLARLGAVFKASKTVEGEGGCGIAHPFEISGFSGGIALAPAARLDCPTARALTLWVEKELKPAAATALETLSGDEDRKGKTVKTIRQASSYICRPRNSQEGAKLSEHGKGRAIDIAGFTLADDTSVTVTPREDDHTIAAALQAAVRKGACLHFTTVLGPGADSFHADHIHLDLADRRGGYRICQ
jgi:hypothetical protein